MAGYIRNDTTNNIADGNIINAADLDGEFDAIASAFTQGGHNHDGTAQQGGAVSKIGPAQQIEVTANTLQPKTNNTTDLGTLGLRFKDLFMHDNNVINLGNNSDITIGYDEATTDSLKIAAKEGSGLAITLMADEGDDAGDEWKLNVADGGVITFGNDIASAGTYVTHLTLTPHATVANSKLALAGILELSDGTAAAPSLTNTGDADAGLFFSAADTLAFTAGGTAQFTMADGVIAPVTDSDVDLGTTNEYFKDAFIDKITTTGVIELGHASETTLSGSGGVLSVEGVAVLVAGAQTGLTTDFNTARKIGRDADNVVDFATTDDEIQFVAAGTKRVTIDAGGLTVDSGSIETATIDYIDGDLAMTIADGGGVTFAQGVTVTGDLTVNGTTTTVNTTNLNVEDPLIKLAKANDGSDTLDIGFYGLYDSTGSQDLYAGLFRDATDGKFRLFKDLQAEPNTTVNTSGTGYAVGTLVANIEVADNIALTSDDAKITFGANNEVELIHDHNVGLKLKHTATTDDNPVSLTLETKETDIETDDILGKIQFKAPDEGNTNDAREVAASIVAIAENAFTTTANPTTLQFKTGSSEAATTKMSLNSAGVLAIPADGSDSANCLSIGGNGDLKIFHDGSTSVIASGSDNNPVAIRADNNEEMATFTVDGAARLYYDGIEKIATTSGGIDVSGAITADGDITAFFTSDQRLKENVVNIPNALDKVMDINGVEFDWSSEYIETHGGEDEWFNRKHQVGVIAQEVEKVLPEVVADRPDGYKAVRYEQLVPLLIEAIKELKTELDELKKGE